MRVASVQFSLSPASSLADFLARIEAHVQQAARDQAQVVLFPEYFSLGYLAHIENVSTFQERLKTFAKRQSEWTQHLKTWAARHQIVIVAGSAPEEYQQHVVNRCYVVFPDGHILYQDKIQMTRFEAEEWDIAGGAPELLTFSVAGTTCGVLICYDVEFPELGRALAQAGVKVLFVPSCTDDIHSYWRVRHSAEARAVENQMLVVMSSIVEGDSRHPEINGHFGQSCILSPCDGAFPPKGLIKEGPENKAATVVADLDLATLDKIRRDGSVLNWRDSKTRLSPIRIRSNG